VNGHDSFYSNPGALLLATSSYYQGNNNLQSSMLAGLFQGLGTTVLANAGLKTLGRILIPGGLAFETHHAMSHALYQGVFQESKPLLHNKQNSPIGVFENVLNYELHIVSGATAGLVYSLASSASKANTATNMLGFAALFGGYDVYSDLFSALLLDEEESPITIIGLSGGCAAMTQTAIMDFRRSILSSNHNIELVSETASRYATAATTQTSNVTTSAMGSKRMMRAFVPGVAAFLVYERFGNWVSSF